MDETTGFITNNQKNHPNKQTNAPESLKPSWAIKRDLESKARANGIAGILIASNRLVSFVLLDV